MFEKTLTQKLKNIFGVKKVTFDQPGESMEQECLFVDIETPMFKIKDKKEIARVTGSCTMYGQAEKIPFGYFAKCIAKADPQDTKDLFFANIESNARQMQNIVERGFDFVYFHSAEYDPAKGEISSLEFTEET